jgi:hypothetical protein
MTFRSPLMKVPSEIMKVVSSLMMFPGGL